MSEGCFFYVQNQTKFIATRQVITIARKKQQVNLYTKENIAILYKYLTKLYGEDNATKLISENESNLFGRNGLAVQLGAICFEFFNYYFLQDHLTGDDKAELSETHREIWGELEDSILNINGDRREYIISRGFGKSSIISEPLAIWCALYNYSIYTVISSSIGSTAEQFIAEIKSILEGNEYVKQGFGEVINKKLKNNTEELELDTRPKKTMIKSISANSSFRGAGKVKTTPTAFLCIKNVGQIVFVQQKVVEKTDQP